MQGNITLLIAGLGLVALASQWLAWKLKAPSIVFLLLSGIIVGPVLGLLDADALFGDLLFPIVSLSVAVILFEGSLTLRFHQIKNMGSIVWRMLSIGIIVTWVVIACAVHWLVGISWELAILFGAIMVVTGPTVITPMLRSVRPTQKVARLLQWEGVVIDPIGAVLALIVFQIILAQRTDPVIGSTLLIVSKVFIVGMASGCLAGYGLGIVLRKHLLPEYLHNVATLLIVLAVFAFADALQHESGLVAVTVMGIWLGNMKGVDTEQILDFKESLSVLLISGLFILLAARLDAGALASIGIPALAVFLAVQFISRPLNILVSTWPGDISWPERGILAWIAPRGIVAAAISALFAIRLEDVGFADADLFVPLTFTVIIGTVIWQGLTAPILARWLGVSEPSPTGILILGGNRVSLSIAQSLHKAGFRITIADTNWDQIRSARMSGLNTYYGNPVSVHADRYLNLIGTGRLFALSRRDEFNTIACLKFQQEFGRKNVYSLYVKRLDTKYDKRGIATKHRGRILFGDDISFTMLSSKMGQGAEIKRTKLSNNYTFADLATNQPNAIYLLAWNNNKSLMVKVAGEPFEPKEGWTVLYLLPQNGNGNNIANGK